MTMAFFIAACGNLATATPIPFEIAGRPAEQTLTELTTYGFTHQRPDGNRYVPGRSSFPNVQHLDIPLDGPPEWVAAAPYKGGTLWVTVARDGDVQGFLVEDRRISDVAITPTKLPGGTPPLLAVTEDEAFLVTPPTGLGSELTHPVPLGESGRLASIGPDRLVIRQGGALLAELPLDPLPDTRLLVDEEERRRLLAGPSERYPHGIAGDRLEATDILLADTTEYPKILQSIPIPREAVVEGISPIWADLDGDGQREIIVTQSDAAQGVQVVVYSESGDLLAKGPAVGRGNRWRHQISVAPFGPNGDVELAEVLTPHIGGIAGFYRMEGNSLELAAQQGGVTTHAIGFRNLDMGLAADLDGDGQSELVIFNQSFDTLTALRRTEDGTDTAWSIQLGAKAKTNLATAVSNDGGISVSVGLDGQTLRVWAAP